MEAVTMTERSEQPENGMRVERNYSQRTKFFMNDFLLLLPPPPSLDIIIFYAVEFHACNEREK